MDHSLPRAPAIRAVRGVTAAYFLAIDFVDHVALVALAEEDGKPTIVGGARYVVVRSGQAEVAFADIDEYQGKGIAAAMMRALASIARQTGLRELRHPVMAVPLDLAVRMNDLMS